MLRADARTETLRRAALFGGAVVFGFLCADWIQDYVHPGARLAIWSLRPWWLFAAVGAYAALVLHDRFLKAASMVLVVQNLVASTLLSQRSARAVAVSSGLIGMFALLLVIAGARRRTRKDIVLAIVTFTGAIVFSLGAKEYARDIVVGRSVTEEHGILR